MGIEHVSDHDLELYSLGRLVETATAPVEEHLLLCDDCQHRLVEWDQYCGAIRGASRQDQRTRPAGLSPQRTRTASSG